MRRPRQQPDRTPEDEARAVVADLANELRWRLSLERVVASMEPDERRFLGAVARAARNARESRRNPDAEA